MARTAVVLTMVAVLGGAVSAALTDGLMLYYDFEQLAGGDGVPDRSPSGYDGLVQGAGSIPLAEGVFGRCSFRSFSFQHVCIQSALCMDMASIGQAGIHIPSKSHFF